MCGFDLNRELQLLVPNLNSFPVFFSSRRVQCVFVPCRVPPTSGNQARGAVRGLRNEEFVLKPGKGQVVCGGEKVVDEVCAALAAADGA